MTTLTTFPHSFHQPYLPNLHNHINHISIEIDKIDKPIMPHEIEDDDHIFIFEKDPIKKSFQVYTMYKHVDKKIRPVSTNFPEGCHIQ